MQLPTASQAYLWVNTIAEGDRGEPHTQEHLLLGKGNVGRNVATLEDLALVGSSAFTERLTARMEALKIAVRLKGTLQGPQASSLLQHDGAAHGLDAARPGFDVVAQ